MLNRLRRFRSTQLLLCAAGGVVLALALSSYLRARNARFAREGAFAYADVLNYFPLLPRGGAGNRRTDGPVCFMRYRFIPNGASTAYTKWRLAACENYRIKSVFITYVASDPALNRPVESVQIGRLMVTSLWGSSAFLLIWGVLKRRGEGAMVGRGGFEVPAIVEAVREESPGHFVLTYSYEAGVTGVQFGQCAITEPEARRLAPGSTGRVRVDPMSPSRSDWLGPPAA